MTKTRQATHADGIMYAKTDDEVIQIICPIFNDSKIISVVQQQNRRISTLPKEVSDIFCALIFSFLAHFISCIFHFWLIFSSC